MNNNIITFSNGLRLWVNPMKNTRSISTGLFVGAGCMYENKENNGIAHYIEHMVFKGTTTRSTYQIVEEMERYGIQINAFTSKNHTAYYTIGIDEYAEKCMEMLSDLYYNPTFTEENLAKEKGVVLEEISMSEDDPEDKCMELLSQAHFGDDIISLPILGTPETVNSFTRKTIDEFLKKYYTPENTFISVVGNITKEKAVKLVKKYFNIDSVKKEPIIFKKERAVPCKQFFKKERDIEQANVGICFPSFGLKEKLSPASSIIMNMLGGGMSSRLFQKLREELGLVYNIYSLDMQYVDEGFVNIFFATNPGTVRQALKGIREVILKVKEEAFSEEEIKKSKAQFKSAIIIAAESSTHLMKAGGKYGILMNKEYDLDKRIKAIEEVTASDIKKALDYIMNISLASLSYVGKDIEGNLLEYFVKGE